LPQKQYLARNYKHNKKYLSGDISALNYIWHDEISFTENTTLLFTQIDFHMNEQLRALLAANCGLPYNAITDDANLSKDLGLDSLDTVDLVLQMEDLFHISIPDEDYQQLQTVRQFSDYLKRKTVAQA